MKQGYSETEGKCYPLFFACKNDSLDVRIDGREQMKAKRKTGAAGLSFLPFSGGGMVSDAVFLRLCRTVRVHGTGDPDGICCGCGWTEEGMESGDVITYRRGNMVVTHRIVEKSEEGYCTKGMPTRRKMQASFWKNR